jgi:hypothetical protein
MITVSVKPNTTALTTIESVKSELGIAVASYDAMINAMIAEASDAIESYTRRKFAQSRVVESLGAFSGFKMLLDRAPIQKVHGVSLDGATIDSVSYSIDNDISGILFKDTTWLSTENYRHHITTWPTGVADKKWAVDYTFGYLLPNDNVSSDSISFSSVDNSINGSGFPLTLVAGQTVSVSGSASNDGEYTVISVSASKVVVEEPISDEAAGATIAVSVRTLPYDIERAAKDLVKFYFLSRNRDPSVESVRVGDYSVGYGSGALRASMAQGGMPPHVQQILKRWIRYV